MLFIGTDPLSVCVREAGATPFIWGSSDCFTRMADWCVRLSERDPAAGLRFTYQDPLGAARIARAQGGFSKLVDMRMRGIGWKRVETAERGDVALVSVVEGGEAFEGLTCALVLAGSTVGWTDAGAVVRTLAASPIIAAWRQ